MVGLLKSTARRLFRSRLLASVVVLLLAVSASVVTTVVCLVDAAFHGATPGVRDTKHLVTLSHVDGAPPDVKETHALSYPAFRFYRQRTDVFTGITAFYRIPVATSLKVGTNSLQVKASLTTADYFDVLGVRPMAGRFFRPLEDAVGSDPACVLASSVVRQLGRTPESIVGNDIQLNGVYVTVIGVAEEFFSGPFLDQSEDMWLPLGLFSRVVQHIAADQRDSYLARDDRRWLQVVARLDSRRTAEAFTIKPFIAGGADITQSAIVRPLTGFRHQKERETYERVSFLLLGMAALVLLVAAANVAGILAAHFWAMRRTFATMMSLGATRGRMFAVIVSDCLTLSLVGILAAIAVTPMILGALAAISGFELGRVVAMSSVLNWRMVLLAGLMTLLLGLGCAVFAGSPRQLFTGVALYAERSEELPPVSRRTWLLAVQALLAFLFTTLHGMLSLGLGTLYGHSSRPGADKLLVASIGVVNHGYDTRQTSYLARSLADQMSLSGQFTAATLSMVPPQTGGGMLARVMIAGSTDPIRVPANLVSPGYFDVVGPQLLRGRPFTNSDQASSESVAIVNEAYASQFLGGEAVAGRTILLQAESTPRRVVGVVADLAEFRGQTGPVPFLYFPLSQPPPGAPLPLNGLTLYVAPATAASIAAVKRSVDSIDAALALHDVRTLADQLRREYKIPRRLVMLIGAVALAGVLLSAIGLFGLVSYLSRLRQKEMAVRVALGGKLLALAREACRPVAVPLGVAAVMGTVLALALGPMMSDAFYGVPLRSVSVMRDPALLAVLVLVAIVGANVVLLRRLEIAGTLRRDT